VKAISIQQPWAWAILHAGKDIENRSWSTTYRGDLAVHATRIQEGAKLPAGVAAPAQAELLLGAVIGLVELADVVKQSSSRWFTGPLGFVLRNPRSLTRPIRCPGNQRIWEVPASVAPAVRRDRPVAHDRPPLRPKEPKATATRFITVTQGNVDNHHLYLTEVMDLFPADVLGGRNESQAGHPVRVLWADQAIETDVVGHRKIFRRRAWLRRFFAANGISAGDRVMFEQLQPDVYRISKAPA
jgi:hypothetical protein